MIHSKFKITIILRVLNRKLKTMKRLLLLFSAMIVFFPRAEASHIVGGDISYQHIEGTTYEVLVRVYRDCFYGDPNAQFDDPASVGIFDQNNNLIQDLRIPVMTDDTLQAVFANPCLFVPDDVCVHTTEYRDTVTLAPLAAGDMYTFVYQRCCRNGTITNIVFPETTGATYLVRMTAESMALDNSTPDFGQPAPIFICLGEPIDYDHSALDVDGDSLVYSFCTPRTGASFSVPRPQPPMEPPYDPIVFADGYDLNTLLGNTSNPMSIDSETGFITGIPEIQGQFVVGVCVEEYRNGELLTTKRRDFQYNVGECLQVQSIAAAPEAQCDNLTVSFENNSSQAEEFLWQFNYPDDLSATSTEVSPSFTYPDTGTYTIRLIAEPNKPCSDTTEFEVFLQENSLTANFKTEVYDCDEESFVQLLDTSVDFVSPIVEWNWVIMYGDTTIISTEQNPLPEIPPGVNGTIEMTVTSENGCVRSATDIFVTGENNPIDLITPQIDLCAGESVELNPDFNAELDFEYTWSPAEGLNATDIENPTASPEVSTVYNVTLAALEGRCINEGEVSIDIIQQPELAFDFQIDCDALSVNFINQSQNVNAYSWDFGDAGSTDNSSDEVSPSFTFSDFGTYEVTLMVSDGELCLDTITQEINLTPRDLSAAFSFEYSDCSEEEIIIQFTNTSVNSLNNTDTYEWVFSNGETSEEAHPTLVLTEEQELTVTLTVTTDEGCENSSTQTLNVDFTELDLAPDPIQICLGTAQGLNPNGNPAYRYLWSPAAGLDDVTAVNPIANPTASTNYTVQVTNISADTCTITGAVAVFVPEAIGLTASDDLVSCEPEATISAATSVPSDLAWSDSGSFASDESTISVPLSGQTVYTLTATDAFNCTETEEVVVAGGPVDINAQGAAVICDDEVLNISVINTDINDQLTYSWSPAESITSGANTANPVVTNEPGIYTFTVEAESQFGCDAIESVDAVIYDTDASFDFDYVIECSGATVSFINNSQNAFGFAWDFGVDGTDEDISTEDNPSFTFPSPGTYSVTLGTFYDVDCVTPTVIEVEIPEVLIIADFVFAYESCETDEIVINFTDMTQNFLNNTTNWLWTFSNGASSDEQNPTIAISEEQSLTATLTVTTADNCTATYEETFEIDFIEENTIGEALICLGDTTQLNPGGDATYTYNWTPGEGLSATDIASPAAFPTETSVYNVTITNQSADLCEITRQVTINVAPAIALEVSEDVQTCGEPVTLTAAGDVAIDAEWIDGNSDMYSGTTIEVLPEAVLTYTIIATDEFGCTETDSVTVANRSMDLSTQDDGSICPQESFTIEAFNNDFTDVVDWQWTAGTGGSILDGGNTATPMVSIESVGIPVSFFVTATNQFDCTALDTVTITMSEFMPTFEAEVPVCTGIATPLNPNANPEYVYEWSPATGLSDPNSPNPDVTLTENQTYTVTITDFLGIDTCFVVETIEVIVNPSIELEAFGDTTLCASETVFVNAQSAVETDFVWSASLDFTNLIGAGESIPVTPMGEVTYYVQATDDLGCHDTAQVSISSFPLDYDLANSLDLCFGESTTINLINNDPAQTLSLTWSPVESIISGATSANPEVNPQISTTFFVDISNQIGCENTDSVFVAVENLGEIIFAEAEPDTILLGSGETSQLTTVENSAYTYEWSPSFSLDDPTVFNPVALPEETTIYTVQITGELGCTDERDVEVVVVDLECREPFVFIPNAFTPNSDGENDVLFVRGTNIDEVFLTIYNRWGENVFETNDKDIGWDGTFKNKPLPPDVYGYYMTVRCFNGMEYFKKGNITLLK